MPDFKDREEYLKWKAERLRQLSGENTPPADVPDGPEQESGTQAEQPVNASPKPREERSDDSLISLDRLFDTTWAVYKRRALPLIVLNILAFFFFALSVGLFMGIALILSMLFGGPEQAFLIGGGITGGLAGIIILCWGLAAVVCAAVDESLGILGALQQGWEKLWPFIWLYSLAGFFLFGGFLLFIIPGFIFLIWFAFGQFIVAEGEASGMAALQKSREYVRGRWGDVFGRLFVVWLVSVGVGMVPCIGSILSLLFMPFMILFTFLLYKDLKGRKGDVTIEPASGEKWQWIGIASLGHVMLVIFIAVVMLLVMTGPCSRIREQMMDRRQHQVIKAPDQALSLCAFGHASSIRPRPFG